MSTIRSGNTETTGLVYQSDVTGNLVFETLGTTAVTISTAQNVTMANALTVSGNISSSSTGFMQMPVGNTAQRPSSPAGGMIRYNSTTKEPEWYDAVGEQWLGFSQSYSYVVDYLIVAGGGSGGGGTYNSGGGGAGGLLSGSVSVFTQTYSIVIGAGGSGTTGYGANGANTTALGLTAIGGGGGGQHPGGNQSGANGGSGGGGSQASGPPGLGTTGQGNNGGGYWYAAGAGGGGAGAAASLGPGGSTVATQAQVSGGIGLQSSINGTNTYYAGGGGGGRRDAYSIPQGLGGNGGGGNGGLDPGNGFAGTANTGGGGGGSGGNDTNTRSGGNGGSGIVIIRYPGAPRGTGGTVSSADGYTIHTFTSSGTFTA